jgi:hypothetical protein
MIGDGRSSQYVQQPQQSQHVTVTAPVGVAARSQDALWAVSSRSSSAPFVSSVPVPLSSANGAQAKRQRSEGQNVRNGSVYTVTAAPTDVESRQKHQQLQLAQQQLQQQQQQQQLAALEQRQQLQRQQQLQRRERSTAIMLARTTDTIGADVAATSNQALALSSAPDYSNSIDAALDGAYSTAKSFLRRFQLFRDDNRRSRRSTENVVCCC